MDQYASKLDWNHLKSFLVTAELGSLSAAGRQMGMTQPNVGRQISALEKSLDLVLFERVGRGLMLTPQGKALLDDIRKMGQHAANIEMIAEQKSQKIAGKITIGASETYAYHLLPKIIAKMRLVEPLIEVEIVATSQSSDLKRREVDIAIRNYRPTEPELIAKKLKMVEAQLYASPEYLKQLGGQSLTHLNQADFIAIDDNRSVMHGLNHIGFDLKDQNFPIKVDSFLVMWAMVKEGIAIGVLDKAIGDLEDGVVPIELGLPKLEYPMWLVAHRELHSSRRVRFVYDFLSDALKK